MSVKGPKGLLMATGRLPSGRGFVVLPGELLEEPAGGRPPLALVLASPVARAVRVLGGRGQPEERDLADLHARIDGNGKVRHVRQLQGQVAVPPGVDVAGGRMDQQAE